MRSSLSVLVGWFLLPPFPDSPLPCRVGCTRRGSSLQLWSVGGGEWGWIERKKEGGGGEQKEEEGGKLEGGFTGVQNTLGRETTVVTV